MEIAIGIADGGGKDVDSLMPLIYSLRKSLECLNEAYSSNFINFIDYGISIDGPMTTFSKKGLGKVKFNKHCKGISIDIGLTEEQIKNTDEAVKTIKSELMAASVKISKFAITIDKDFNTVQFINDTEKIFNLQP
jgi:hypothetical protein